jgi:hypothetical protein
MTIDATINTLLLSVEPLQRLSQVRLSGKAAYRWAQREKSKQ